jgi:hypothetical protein
MQCWPSNRHCHCLELRELLLYWGLHPKPSHLLTARLLVAAAQPALCARQKHSYASYRLTGRCPQPNRCRAPGTTHAKWVRCAGQSAGVSLVPRLLRADALPLCAWRSVRLSSSVGTTLRWDQSDPSHHTPPNNTQGIGRILSNLMELKS